MAWPWRSSVVTEASGDTRHEKGPEVNCLYFARSDVSVLNNKRQKYRLAVFAGGKQRRGKTFRVTVPALRMPTSYQHVFFPHCSFYISYGTFWENFFQ